MKRIDRLARSGAVYTARETLRRERPFGLALLGVIIIVTLGLVLLQACQSQPLGGKPVSALVVSAAGFTSSTSGSNHELLLPAVSNNWPPKAMSNCTSEDESCN